LYLTYTVGINGEKIKRMKKYNKPMDSGYGNPPYIIVNKYPTNTGKGDSLRKIKLKQRKVKMEKIIQNIDEQN